MKNYKEAEEALAEANLLDNTNSFVWGYLCLVNLQLERPVQSQQCYKHALKVSFFKPKPGDSMRLCVSM